MQFDGFDWDDGNREKCRKHGVTALAIENLFHRPVVILPDRNNPQGETRFRAIGRTMEGRGIFIVFTWRRRSDELRLRPISARYMHAKELATYEKAYPDV